MTAKLKPWLKTAFQSLKALSQHRLSQAILLQGPEGLGKEELAVFWLKSLACLTPNSEAQACDLCHSCLLWVNGSHPDRFVLQEAAHKAIPISASRELIIWLQSYPQISSKRLVLIPKVHNLGISAANALLKTIEELPPYALCVACSDRPAMIVPTLLSRFFRMNITSPSQNDAIFWLASQGLQEVAAIDYLRLAGGSPLKALSLATERSVLFNLAQQLNGLLNGELCPVKLASTSLKQELMPVLHTLWLLLKELLRCCYKIPPASLYKDDFFDQLWLMSVDLNPQKLSCLIEDLTEKMAVVEAVALNNQMVLETIWIAWQTCRNSPRSLPLQGVS